MSRQFPADRLWQNPGHVLGLVGNPIRAQGFSVYSHQIGVQEVIFHIDSQEGSLCIVQRNPVARFSHFPLGLFLPHFHDKIALSQIVNQIGYG